MEQIIKMWVIVGVLASSMSIARGSEETDSVSERFTKAKLEFEYKNFAQAVKILRLLLYPTVQFTQEEDIVEGRAMLGLAYFYLGKRDRAREEFTALLYLRPQYDMDPFLVPPPAVEFFNAIRHNLLMQEKLRRVEGKNAEHDQKKNKQVQSVFRHIYTERTIERHSRFVACMPFGVGQFQNSHSTKGTTLAISAGATLGVNVFTFLFVWTLRDKDGYYAQDKLDLARGLQIAQYVSLGAFVALWVYGVIDANYYFQPVIEIKEKSLD
jgi:hypothetical protein